jgi:hypothetical protein
VAANGRIRERLIASGDLKRKVIASPLNRLGM